jgi:hypothetical protein
MLGLGGDGYVFCELEALYSIERMSHVYLIR